jgi:hypothetical protein
MRGRVDRGQRLVVGVRPAAALTLVLLLVGAAASQDSGQPAKAKNAAAKAPPVKLGLSVNEPRALQGYTLLCPLNSTTTYLLDMQGRVVRTWESDCSPALCPYLLENGHVLRPGSIGADAQAFGGGPGVGGRVQEFTWEGDVIWDFQFVNARQLPHHDIAPLPNGNVLMIVWDRKTTREAIAAGRRPELTGDSHLLPDSLIEVKPTGKTTGAVVWEWHLWDHLVQDYDKSKANYGNVAEHPELVNINYGEDALAPVATTKAAQDKLKSIGYVGANAAVGRPQRANPDWTHCNGVSYHPEFDQIMVSVHAFSEFWILDHSTTTAEATGHTGGRYGKGGDLLYRWGNPRAYRAGTKADQRLFGQHNAHWIPTGLPGEGHVLVFNNGGNRPHGSSYSSVDELVLPVDPQGRYTSKPGAAYGPDRPVWSYTAPKKADFYSFFISGAQRLPNGNTLICSGANGTVFEVTPEKKVVWNYVNPVKGDMVGPGGFGPPAPPGGVMSPILRDILGMSAEQRKQLDAIQNEVDAHFDQLLTADQKKQLQGKRRPATPGGFGPVPQAIQLLPTAEQNRLKLSGDQKKELAALQKKVDGELAKMLTAEQKKQLKGGSAFGGPPGGAGVRGPTRPGELVPSFLQDALQMSAEQRKQLNEFQKEADGKLDMLLVGEQKKQFKEPPAGGGLPQPGQFMLPTLQARLKLSAEQRRQLQGFQKEADAMLARLFSDEQKKQFKQLAANFGRGGPGGPPGAGGGRPGGPPNLGPPGGSPVFRAYRFAASYQGLVGRDLTPGKSIEELQHKVAQAKDPATRK